MIDWVMKAEGVSFRHAVELLRERHLPSLDAEGAPKIVKNSTVKKLPVVLEWTADDEKRLRRVIDYCHETLKQSPEGLEYLSKRGLEHPEVISVSSC